MIVSKSIDLTKLLTEAAAAGVSLPRGLGLNGTNLFTYDAAGEPIEPPAGLAAVVTAHTDTRPTDEQRVQAATTYLRGVNFAARKTAIDATALSAQAKTILKTINKTEWALAVVLHHVVADDPGE